MIDWKVYYEDYPVNHQWIWLNNCGTTPMGSKIKKSVFEYLDSYSSHGVLSEIKTFPAVRRDIIQILSSLLNAEKEELAIIHNTSEGMNFISHGIELKPGDKIILMENEYPSNVYPWTFWKDKGVTIEFVPVGETQEEFLANLKVMITENTRVISISAVHWCTGMPLPLEEVGAMCKENKIFFVVDGAQGVGHVPINVKKMNIDFMAFSAWKWLLGPLGLGVLFVTQENMAKMSSTFIGQSSVVNPEQYLPYKSALLPGADRFEYSTPNFTDWVYFDAALRMLNEIGFAQVMARLYSLSDYLHRGLRSQGFELLKEKFQKNTGIIVFEKKEQSSHSIQKYLKENGVICAVRLEKLRMAPHIYNSYEQLDKVLELLAKNGKD